METSALVPLALHTTKTVQKAGGNYGSYKFTLDKATHVIIRYDATNNQLTITAQNLNYDLYVLGAINSQSWHANEGTLMTKNGDNYTLTNVYIKNGAKFSFTTALGASADDWDSIKGSRIGSNATSGDNPAWWINSDMIGTAQNAMGTMGTHYDFYFNAESGYYDMEVNLVNGTIKSRHRPTPSSMSSTRPTRSSMLSRATPNSTVEATATTWATLGRLAMWSGTPGPARWPAAQATPSTSRCATSTSRRRASV